MPSTPEDNFWNSPNIKVHQNDETCMPRPSLPSYMAVFLFKSTKIALKFKGS